MTRRYYCRMALLVSILMLVTLMSPFLTPVTAFEGVETFPVIIDAHVQQFNPDSNFGTSSQLWVESLFLTGTDRNRRTYLDFNMTAVEAFLVNKTLVSATLVLTAFASVTDGGNRTYLVHQVGATWTEGGITWNTQPSVTATSVSATFDLNDPGVSGLISHSFAVTSIVQNWLASQGRFGFRVRDNVESSPMPDDARSSYNSREGTNEATRPILRIGWEAFFLQGIPDPADMLGLIAFIVIIFGGSLFLAGLARRYRE